jgi:hypothetical protein
MGLTLSADSLGQPGKLAADRRYSQCLAVLADGLILKLAHQALPMQGVDTSSVS